MIKSHNSNFNFKETLSDLFQFHLHQVHTVWSHAVVCLWFFYMSISWLALTSFSSDISEKNVHFKVKIWLSFIFSLSKIQNITKNAFCIACLIINFCELVLCFKKTQHFLHLTSNRRKRHKELVFGLHAFYIYGEELTYVPVIVH